MIEKIQSGEERLVLKNTKGLQLASGDLLSSKGISRRKLKNISRDAADAEVEIQLKEGYDVKDGTKFEVFRADNDKISFRLRESGGNILISGNTFASISDCMAAINETRESLRDMSNSSELTAIHKMPAFVKKKASPRFASLSEELKQAEKRSKDMGFTVTMSEKKRPIFISGRISDEKITSSKKAISALNFLHHTMGFENAEQEFDEDDIDIRRQNDGTVFYRMQQYHKGIPVFANTLIISTDVEGNTETLNGHYTPISCNDEVKITEEQAKAVAEKYSGKAESSEGLIYYVDDNDKASLCWCINTMEHQLFISTANGAVIKKFSNIDNIDINTNRRATTTTGATVDISILNKEGHSPFSLRDGARHIEIYDDHNNKNSETAFEVSSMSTENQARLTETHAVTAYDNINRVYDYYLNVLGRKGADNHGKRIRIVMNDHSFTNEANAAFYRGVTDYTRIGISTLGNMERCLDILGHEFTHAVNNAIWTPVKESYPGALNEAYADIMGEFIQDGTLDDHGEGKTMGSPRHFNNSRTMDNFDASKSFHYNSGIISHAAYLIYDRWPDENKRCELSLLFYRSMEYMEPRSNFSDCYSALLMSALKNCSSEKQSKKIGVIADAFLETRIFPNINSYKNSGSAVKVKGKVILSSTGKGVPGVTVSAFPANNTTDCKFSTITNSSGEYELTLSKGSSYIIKTLRYDGYKGEVNTGTITDKNCGPWNISTNCNWLLTSVINLIRPTFMIRGYVKHPDTGRPVAGATVRIVKGQNSESQVMTMKPEAVLTTDSSGYFFTAALPRGQYDVWAYSEIKDSPYCLTRIANISNVTEAEINLTLERKKRFYVSSFCIHYGGSESGAKSTVQSGTTLIDVDLNKNAPKGAWLYMTYSVSNTCDPITNLLIYESDQVEKWKTKSLTHKGITAVYNRLDVDLNMFSGGKHLYLCSTRDKRFDPLTKLDVLVKEKDVVRAPHWSGVRVVRNGSSSVDSYANINEGITASDTIHIMQTRKEIM